MKLASVLAATAGMLVVSLAACGQSATTPADATDTTTSAEMTTPAPAPVTAADFVSKVAMSDMYEVQASQLAARRGGNAQIRSFATTMVHDHTATTAALRALVAAHADLPLPAALDEQHQNMLNELVQASAADFDQKYVDQQTHAHQDAVSLLTDYAQNGDNADLKAFAADTAPKVQHHLDMVQALDHSGADEPSASHG